MKLRTTSKYEEVFKHGRNRYEAKTAKQLVKELARMSFGQPGNTNEQMAQMSLRLWRWDKSHVRTTNEENFVADLITCGFLKVWRKSRKRKPLDDIICNTLVWSGGISLVARFIIGITFDI